MSDSSTAYGVKIFSPHHSVFVSANAGAGKTSLLTRRVLSLLLHEVSPQKILCLTFTKAAAAEMSARIQSELGAWVMADDDTLVKALEPLLGKTPERTQIARARCLFAQVLEAPDGIRMQTIHSFCQSLLRRFPLEAGVSPHFTVMDSRTEQELLQEARQRLFSRAYSHDEAVQRSLHALARRLSESVFRDMLAEIVGNKRAFQALFSSPGGAVAAIGEMWKRAQMQEGTTVAHLVENYFRYDDAALSDLRRAADILMRGKPTDVKTGEKLALWLENGSRRVALAEAYSAVFLTEKGEPRKKLFTKDALSDASLADRLAHEQERVVRYNEALRTLSIVRMSGDVLMVAEALLAIYDELKRARAGMDYDDLILGCERLLHKPGISAWVLYKLDGGIDHVLVDEAQDTNPEQWSITGALTEDFFSGLSRSDSPRSLFIVGDEKQSIFSFQGADVEALGKMQRYFRRRIDEAQMASINVTLRHSYRSVPEVLQAVDAIFANPAARKGLVFEDVSLEHIPTRSAAGLVELWPLVKPQPGDMRSPATHLSRLLADTIRTWIANGQARAGDIMILVGRRTGFVDAMVRSLKRRGVPVAGVDRMKLGQNLAVQDLIALGQCLLLPDDDLTLAALLKSPIGGIGEDDLFALCWDRGDKTVWERLQASRSKPCMEAYALLTDLRGKADYVAPYELYTYLLDTLGARRKFTGRMGEEYGEPIDEFLTQTLLYERANTPSLQGFLHWMTASESEIKRDMEQATDAVRIMTVHGAKGLQAPIVILPDTVEPPRLHDKLLWHDEAGLSLPLWSPSMSRDNTTCARLREAQKEAMYAEYRRLFYVALTRAEDRLYICGATGRENVHEQSWYHFAQVGLAEVTTLCETPAGEGRRLGEYIPSPARGGGLGRGQAGLEFKEVPLPASPLQGEELAFLTRVAPDEPVPPRPLTPSRMADDEPPAASPLLAERVFTRGRVIHKLLQHLPEVEEDKRVDVARRLVREWAHVLEGDALEHSIREALALIGNASYSFLFSRNSLAEVPVAGSVTWRGKPVQVAGQIDRLAVGEREAWVVDYKTNRQPPRDVADISPAYLRQMALYRLLMQRIYPEKTIRCGLLWTAVPRLDMLSDALLDEAPANT